MKKAIFLTLLSLVAMTSCRRTEISTVGTLDLRITDIGDYSTVQTRATDYSDFSNYDVVIEGPTKYEAKFSQFRGEVVELGSGSYTITVTSPDTEPAAFGQPIYQAYEEFVIKAGEVTPLDLVCRPINCKVTIVLTDNFVKELSSYEVVVSNGLGQLKWEKNSEKNDFSDTKEGYFLPRGLEVKVKGYRSIDNTEATAVYYVQNPQAAEHHILTIDAKVTGEIDGINIRIETNFNEVNQNVDIDGMEEDYVDRPDFGDDDDDDDGDGEEGEKNTIEWAANPTFAPLNITPETQVQMTIKMPAGIASFVVEVSDNFKDAVAAITDGGVTYIDLINDPAILENFADSPLLTGNEILNQTEVNFDLSTFIPILCSAAQGMTVDFILKAKDNKGADLLFMDDFPVVTMIIPQ